MIENYSNALINDSFLSIKEYQFIGALLFGTILLVSIITIIVNSKCRHIIESFFSVEKDKISNFFSLVTQKLCIQDTSLLKVQNYAPLDNIKEHHYFLSIDSALKDPNVKNFAMLGNYASGKSSIIQSYFKNYSFNRRKLKNDEYLSISLAEFDYNKSGNEKKSELNLLNNLEKEIVRQIFCSTLRKYIPFSFSSSLKKSKHVVCSLTFFITLLLVVTICHVSDKQVPQIILGYYNFCLSNVIAFGVFISVIVILLYGLLSVFSIKLLSIDSVIGAFKVELEKNSSNSVIDEFFEQILFLLKKSKCNFVIFEDLEKVNNYEVFIHLRNLNLLINDNLTKKKLFRKSNRKIVFIYLLTETVFKSHLDIFKFFDYTLSLCPVSSSSNSCSHMIKMRKEMYEYYKNKTDKKIQKFYDSEKYSRMYSSEYLSNDYLIFLSNFIFDLRLIKKIFNDYQTLFGGFTKLNNLHEFSEVIFSLAVLRSMFPKEYYKLSKNEGVMYEILNKVACLGENGELPQSELTYIKYKFTNNVLLSNNYICKILETKKLAENYRLFMSNLSENILSDEDREYILCLFNSETRYIPDLNLSLDNGELDIILSYFPNYLIKKIQVLNYSLFSLLIQKSKGFLSEFKALRLANGEPSIIKDDIKLADYCVENSIPVEIYTNGAKVPKTFVDGVNKGLFRIILSPDAGSREVYKKIKGKDYFETTWFNIKKYVEETSGNVEVKFILEKGNIDDVDNMINMCLKTGVNKVHLSMDVNISETEFYKYESSFSHFVNRCKNEGINLLSIFTFVPEQIKNKVSNLSTE